MGGLAPLPRGWANELIRHLQTCPTCVGAKAARVPSRCPRRKELIQLTLKERHGEE